MTKLKTLKDFSKYKGDIICYSDELRQNAIRWIKRLSSDHPFESGDEILNMDQYIKGQIDWIKNFFNITEEEINMDNPTSENKESKKTLDT